MGISTSTFIRNFIVIFLTSISTLLILFILKWICEAIMTYVEKFANFITFKVILKWKWEYLLVFCEMNILITPIIVLIIMRKCIGNISLVVFFLLLLIGSLITSCIRKQRENIFSLIGYIASRINMDNYFINRINLLFEQGLSIIILIVFYEFTLLIFTQLEWPLPLQYVAFVALPVYLNIWIYFSYKFKLKDVATINIRRIIIYLLLAVYVLGDCYSKFYSMAYYDTSPKLELNNLFIYIISVSFIALERVMKSITDDFEIFTKKADRN